MMKFYGFILAAAFMAFGCNDQAENEDSLLEKPPYDKITDSIRLAPQNAALYYHRGSLFYHNNQLLHAEKDLRKAWQLDPSEAHALAVTTVLKQKNTDSAISFLKEALQKMPGSISLQIGLARGYQQKNQLKEAENICDRLLSAYPNQIDALLLKSELLGQQNKPSEAIALKETAFNYSPNDIELAYDLAYDYAEAKNEKAVKLGDRLLRLDSTENSAKAFYVKAKYYANIGKSKDAILNYNAAIARNYNFLDAYLDKGELFYQQKKYAAALQVFQLGQRISPATAEFYFAIAKTQEATGNKAEAKLNYQKAFSLDKTMTEAKRAAEQL